MSSVVCGRGHLVYQYMKDWGTKLEYLFVIDVEEPTAPVDLGVLEMSNRVDSALCPMHMRLRGGFLYACTNDSVLIFDVTDPTEPKQVSTFSSRPPGTNIYRRLELAGDYLYVQAVATPQRGADERHPLDSSLRDETRSQYILQIWNIGDLKNPVLSAVCWEPQGGLLGVHGDVLYTSRQVFDITSRTAPQQIADLGLTPVPRSICGFDGQYLYTDVATVDVSDPSSPVVVDSIEHILDEDWESDPGAAKKGDLLLVPGNYHGMDCVQVFDVSNPLDSELASVAYSPTSSFHSRTAVAGDVIVVVDGIGSDDAHVRYLADDQAVSFDAFGWNGHVETEWRVTDPTSVVGFYMYRAPAGGGDYSRLSQELIEPSDTPYTEDGGYTYRFPDTEAELEETYVYLLRAIFEDGTERHCVEPAVTHLDRPLCWICTPEAGQLLFDDAAATLRWTTSDEGEIEKVSFYYSLDGAPYVHIADSTDDGVFEWTPSLDVQEFTRCRVRIEVEDETGLVGSEESSEFYIRPGGEEAFPVEVLGDSPSLVCPCGESPSPLALEVTVLDASGSPVVGKSTSDIWLEPCDSTSFGLPCSAEGLVHPLTPTDTDGKTTIEVSEAGGYGRDAPLKVTIHDQGVDYWVQVATDVRSPDYFADGTVDAVDFSVFGGDFGSQSWRSDFDGSGEVGPGDMSTFSSHFGHGCGNRQTVPIPAELARRFGLSVTDTQEQDERRLPLSFQLATPTPNPSLACHSYRTLSRPRAAVL